MFRMRRSPIAREGIPFIAFFLAPSVALFMLGLHILATITFAIALFVAYFFRDPERRTPPLSGIVVSPADGKVIERDEHSIDPYTNTPAKKLSIFMSIFNVHVNRAPLSGRVKEMFYNKGRFLIASAKGASKENERNAVVLELAPDKTVTVVQIAGFIARRIVCRLKVGDFIAQGERFGMIRFGSRVDLYLPPDTVILADVGEDVRAGETIIGRLE